eukprot:2506707-Pyramimonas_sp.AAC.1
MNCLTLTKSFAGLAPPGRMLNLTGGRVYANSENQVELRSFVGGGGLKNEDSEWVAQTPPA